jgi:hypothetical protein
MPSLVEELQRDALDGRIDVADLLRKAFVVASKLDLGDFKKWCESELKGYTHGPLPIYRVLHGTLRAWNPYNGWIPVFIEDTEIANRLSTHQEPSPIGAIQDLMSNSDGGNFTVRLSSTAQKYLLRGMNVPLESSLRLGRSEVARLLDAVRNLILDWSLRLESDGIKGDGMSFSTDEKEIARRNSDDLQSVVNYIKIENMVNSSIQQSSPAAR